MRRRNGSFGLSIWNWNPSPLVVVQVAKTGASGERLDEARSNVSKLVLFVAVSKSCSGLPGRLATTCYNTVALATPAAPYATSSCFSDRDARLLGLVKAPGLLHRQRSGKQFSNVAGHGTLGPASFRPCWAVGPVFPFPTTF